MLGIIKEEQEEVRIRKNICVRSAFLRSASRVYSYDIGEIIICSRSSILLGCCSISLVVGAIGGAGFTPMALFSQQ